MDPLASQANPRNWPQSRAQAPSPSPYQASQPSTAQQNTDFALGNIAQLTVRNNCKNILRTVPFYTVQNCLDALIKVEGNTEKAVLYLSDSKRMAARSPSQLESALRGNSMVEPQIKIDTMKLQRNSPGASLQSCYLALKIAQGDYEKAAKQMERDSGRSD
ncbi:hypothetical protein PMZ80_001064 [Knufia obscura]|uniref:Uncharacterized protein n=2 Tax=Knufia TaxID=430999 RepID=A0AAN8EMA7_9EURO|nr:hypothetical protein PMZ80_001064 [Knufia obscura]KAK5958869.1 hypothetical protein OHC33_000713 [Knufia fluminis]